MKRVEVMWNYQFKNSSNRILPLIAPKALLHQYASDELICFWVIDNDLFMMKKFEYTALITYADNEKCSIIHFYEGYHLGGKCFLYTFIL